MAAGFGVFISLHSVKYFHQIMDLSLLQGTCLHVERLVAKTGLVKILNLIIIEFQQVNDYRRFSYLI